MARGRPALATVLMITGAIALAVPLSTAFAGEFLILAGIFMQGWFWAVIGVISIVLAAMYVLRLISAVLHEKVGSSVSEARSTSARRARGRRPARRAAARALRLAERDHRPLVRGARRGVGRIVEQGRRAERARGRGSRRLARRAARLLVDGEKYLNAPSSTGTFILDCADGDRVRLTSKPRSARRPRVSWSKP